MGRRTRTEIIIETERVVLVSRRNAPFVMWCDRCQAHLPTVTPPQAALLLQLSMTALHQLIQLHRLHVIEERDGLLLICLNSLCHRN